MHGTIRRKGRSPYNRLVAEIRSQRILPATRLDRQERRFASLHHCGSSTVIASARDRLGRDGAGVGTAREPPEGEGESGRNQLNSGWLPRLFRSVLDLDQVNHGSWQTRFEIVGQTIKRRMCAFKDAPRREGKIMNSEQLLRIRGDPGFQKKKASNLPPVFRGAGTLFGKLGLLIIPLVAMTLPNVVLSEELSWHQQSRSYDVDLGVVSSRVAAQDELLVAIHKAAPHGAHKHSAKTRHILVTVFSRPSMERVTDATVVAEVVENDLVHLKKTKKPLEMMAIAGAVTYCNFFDLHWNGKYRIHVRIHEPGNETEEVTFLQEARGLPQ